MLGQAEGMEREVMEREVMERSDGKGWAHPPLAFQ